MSGSRDELAGCPGLNQSGAHPSTRALPHPRFSCPAREVVARYEKLVPFRSPWRAPRVRSMESVFIDSSVKTAPPATKSYRNAGPTCPDAPRASIWSNRAGPIADAYEMYPPSSCCPREEQITPMTAPDALVTGPPDIPGSKRDDVRKHGKGAKC